MHMINKHRTHAARSATHTPKHLEQVRGNNSGAIDHWRHAAINMVHR